MISYKITDIKAFTSALFVKEVFDRFLVCEATIQTSNTFHIDGKLQLDYFNDVEKEELEDLEYSFWKQLRPTCFHLIKGSKLPLSFKIVLKLSKSNVEKLVQQTGLTGKFDIEGLLLNIIYRNGEIHCITGTSLKQFTLDKSLEKEWDLMVGKFFKHNQMDFEEM